MKVELLDHTQDAMNLLLRTKNTRLQNTDDDPAQWDEAKKQAHLDYMRDTIQSSWEFVSYTFEISEVTRAFTHQLVRTRTGAYAQESQRTIDASENGYMVPEFQNSLDETYYRHGAGTAFTYYKILLERGMPAQDARGLLPTATFTSIIAKFSLRALHDMALVRLCTRTQGEYQDVFRAMKASVVEVHPWAEPFIRVACAQTGVCIFPRYTKCPIQKFTYNGYAPEMHKAKLSEVQQEWELIRHEAVPVATGGRTM